MPSESISPKSILNSALIADMNQPSCNVCATPLSHLLYESEGSQSLTSLCQVIPGTTRVYACAECGHLQTEEMADSVAFYESDYDILVHSEEEDQIYEVRPDGTQIYRTDHQVNILLETLPLPTGARILDYGCAKSAMIKRLLSHRPDLQAYLFDVSSRYIPFWERFLKSDRWAVHELPNDWSDSFDIVMSFFSMEHMVRPEESIRMMAAMLKPGGTLYCIVPNVCTNIADFIVLDHVNHFSSPSLQHLLQNAGLEVVSIDDTSHRGAYVLVARRTTQPELLTLSDNFSQQVQECLTRFQEIGLFWKSAAGMIRSQEAQIPQDTEVAIYGAGFYSAFVVSCLRAPQRVFCHLDQNVYLQGREINGRSILSPAQLPENIKHVWVGLNPAHARKIIPEVEALSKRQVSYLFLD